MTSPNAALQSTMKITRRALTQMVLAQVAVSQTPPATPSSPEELLTAAKEQTKRSTESLAKVAVPMSTEPAFSFKA